jgi:hypothetical protein
VAQLHGGVPWDRIPADVLPATAMLQNAHDAQPRRMSVLQEALGQSSRTFHPMHNVPDENGS